MSKASRAADAAQSAKAAEAAVAAAAATEEAKATAIALADQFPAYVSHKVVRAAIITEVLEDGCMVIAVDGAPEVKLLFLPEMTSRYMPVAGDRWVFYPDGYQSLSPADPFVDGYTLESDEDAADAPSEAETPARPAIDHGLGILAPTDGSVVVQWAEPGGGVGSRTLAADSGMLGDLRRSLASLWAHIAASVPAAEE